MVMDRDLIAFLLEAAEDFRRLASQAPDLANTLRRMAEECEAEAGQLRQAGGSVA